MFPTSGGENPAASLIGVPDAVLGKVPATTFRDNDYIQQLNHLLQSELSAVSAFGQCRIKARQDAMKQFATDHQRAGRSLVQLIVANRGIPDDRAQLSSRVTSAVIQVAGVMPSWFNERATLSTLARVEGNLTVRYRKAIDSAPARDLEALTNLLKEAERRYQDLADPRST